MSNVPVKRAMHAAHDALAEDGAEALAPETVEKIAKAAIAAYLSALADEHRIVTGHEAGIDGGDSWTHRPIYSPDLRVLAREMSEAPYIGPWAAEPDPFSYTHGL